METLLLAVTVFSLLVALLMSVAAWRLSRDDRARTAARVAALAAAVPDIEQPARAAVMNASAFESEFAQTAVAEPRGAAPWSTPRVAAVTPFAAPRPAARAVFGDDFLPAEPARMSDGFLGSAATPASSSNRQRGLAVAAAVLFVFALAGGYWAVYGGPSAAASASTTATERAALELISLRHERRGSRLAVTGLVRNPVAGASVEKLTAVVFLFDQQGAFLSSARANVDFLTLAPGDESPFVIDVEAPATVARYRVSFRNDGGTVPHIDRRGEQPLAAGTSESEAAGEHAGS